MYAKVRTYSIFGLEAKKIEIEVDIQPGLPAVNIVGLPDASIKEAKDRVRSAIIHSGYNFPIKKITVNLAPADLKKIGSHYDLAIAMGILIASEQVEIKNHEYILLGELSLSGEIRPVKGTLIISKEINKNDYKSVILPEENKYEANLFEALKVFPAKNIKDVVDILTGKKTQYIQNDFTKHVELENDFELDFADVQGHYNVKRSIEIASAGHHNIMLMGPPGCGKSMMAKRISSILPPLSLEEAIETSEIYSVAGLLPNNSGLLKKRPFRSPHHTASYASIAGGGRIPKPGEVSLSHNGVLFIDEAPEFKKNVLQVLREPIEEKQITISRVDYSVVMPSRFMLVLALNPCPCGYANSNNRACVCSEKQKKNYISTISGPLLDRIDIQIEVNNVPFDELTRKISTESSVNIRERVINARNIQNERYKKLNIYTNSQLTGKVINKYCELSKESNEIIKKAIEKFKLSARAYHKILKVSRTIADLNNRDKINIEDVLEAIQYRQLDKILK